MVGFGGFGTADSFVGGIRSSLTVSGGRPSFFLRFFSPGFDAREGFVRPIAAAFAFHGSGAPYRIGIPAKIRLINEIWMNET